MVDRIARAEARYGVLPGTRPLLQAFTTTCDPLWHYTNSREAAEAIRGGRVWLTRADCLIDQQEIQHGLELLREALGPSPEDSRDLTDALSDLTVCLRSTYVFSLTTLDPNPYLHANYARTSGFRIGFTANLASALFQGWESFKAPGDSTQSPCVQDCFDYFEGEVIYDLQRQKEVAQLAREAVLDWQQNSGARDAERYASTHHLHEALVSCALLFKREGYSQEREYRVCLIRRPDARNLEKTRPADARAVFFADVYSPGVKEMAELHEL